MPWTQPLADATYRATVLDSAHGQFGALLPDAAELLRHPRALPPQWVRCGSAPILPPRAVFANPPLVVMQGTPNDMGAPGSCEAQSYGYGLAMSVLQAAQGYDPTNTDYQTSPAWLYGNQLNLQAPDKHGCGGTAGTEYLCQLIQYGCPSAAQVPYEPNCAYLRGVDRDLGDYGVTPGLFLLGGYGIFPITPGERPSLLPMIKAFLASGQAVAFSGPVLQGYFDPVLTDGIITETEIMKNSGHGQFLVGYDDYVGPPDNPGAFLVQNSFGTAWPLAMNGGGRVWWSYDSFFETQQVAAVAYPCDPGWWGVPLLGASLLTGNPAAPAGTLQYVAHWCPDNGHAYLVLLLSFANPVKIDAVTIGDAAGGDTATGQYYRPVVNGFAFFCRTDGNQFDNATYDLTVSATTAAGAATYTGRFAVGAAAPTTMPQAPIGVSANITDTTGAPATIRT